MPLQDPGLQAGDGIEICPLAMSVAEDLASRVVKDGGAALLIDYGEVLTQADSLRGFQAHDQVSMNTQYTQSNPT